jgi:hypothetical protein
MTQNEFVAECVSRTIDPAIALENEKVRRALTDRDDDKVRSTLDTEF